MNVFHPIYTEEAECQDCYKCVRECTVKAIKIKDGKASIIEDECILCGHCVDVCPVHAKRVRNDIEKAIDLLNKKDRVIVSLAPSFVTEFADIPPERLIFILKRLGFYGVSETALGAEELSANVATYIEKSKNKYFISTACPVIVNYICKYYPNYVPYLTPFLSPVLTHCKILRKIYGEDIGIVFIGPCIAKKKEADMHPELLDVALTFEELREWIRLKESYIEMPLTGGQNVQEGFIPNPAQEGRLYPVDGGMLNSIKYKCSFDELQFMSFSGVKKLDSILKEMEKISEENPIFLELLACEGGCINGPKIKKEDGLIVKRYEVIKYTSVAKDRIPGEPQYNIEEKIEKHPIRDEDIPEEEIIKALHSVGKYTSRDELNCGGCGYNSCRDFAKALVKGKTEPSMCVSYMRKLAQKKANALIKTMPCGVVIVDEELRIVECNRQFASLIKEEKFYEATGFEGAYLSKLTNFSGIFEIVLENANEVLEKDVKYKGAVLHVIAFTIEPHRYVGGIIQDITDPLVQKEQVIKRAREVIDKNLSTVQEVAFLLGESAAETEKILNSIIELFAPEDIDEVGDRDEY